MPDFAAFHAGKRAEALANLPNLPASAMSLRQAVALEVLKAALATGVSGPPEKVARAAVEVADHFCSALQGCDDPAPAGGKAEAEEEAKGKKGK